MQPAFQPLPGITFMRGYVHWKFTTSLPITMHRMVMLSPWRTTVCTAFTETLMDDTGVGQRDWIRAKDVITSQPPAIVLGNASGPRETSAIVKTSCTESISVIIKLPLYANTVLDTGARGENAQTNLFLHGADNEIAKSGSPNPVFWESKFTKHFSHAKHLNLTLILW